METVKFLLVTKDYKTIISIPLNTFEEAKELWIKTGEQFVIVKSFYG